MSPLLRQAASTAWLGDAILAVTLPAGAATGVELIDLYWFFLWIGGESRALLRRFDFGALGRLFGALGERLGERCAYHT